MHLDNVGHNLLRLKGAVLAVLILSSCANAAEPDSTARTSVSVSGSVDGHNFVDVGLPVLWATANVGAKTPAEEGEVVAWGELVSNVEFDWHTYKYSGDSCNSIKKYCMAADYGLVDAVSELTAEADAAVANWSDNWRTPTEDDFNALRMCCSWEWVDDFDCTGVCGLWGISKINGNTIFFPASEYEESKDDPKTYFQGWYWTASLGSGENGTALQFVFKKGAKMEDIGVMPVPRCYGRLVRPVTNKK